MAKVEAADPRWRGMAVLLAAVALAALTARLGWWQLDRAAQKLALRAAIEAQGALPPLPQAELARASAEVAAQVHRRVQLRGQWLNEHTVYLENRQMGGRTGFYVLTPLQLGPGDAVLVQRGWVPRDLLDRSRIVAPSAPAGTVQIEGRMAAAPARLYEFDAAASGPIRQNLDVASFARESGLPLRPLFVLQLQDSAGAPDGLQRDWPGAQVDVSKHHGYAFQWFALSALTTALYVWFQLIRPRRARARTRVS